MIDMLPTRTVAPPAWLTAGKRHESPSMIVSMPATFGYHVGGWSGAFTAAVIGGAGLAVGGLLVAYLMKKTPAATTPPPGGAGAGAGAGTGTPPKDAFDIIEDSKLRADSRAAYQKMKATPAECAAMFALATKIDTEKNSKSRTDAQALEYAAAYLALDSHARSLGCVPPAAPPPAGDGSGGAGGGAGGADGTGSGSGTGPGTTDPTTPGPGGVPGLGTPPTPSVLGATQGKADGKIDHDTGAARNPRPESFFDAAWTTVENDAYLDAYRFAYDAEFDKPRAAPTPPPPAPPPAAPPPPAPVGVEPHINTFMTSFDGSVLYLMSDGTTTTMPTNGQRERYNREHPEAPAPAIVASPTPPPPVVGVEPHITTFTSLFGGVQYLMSDGTVTTTPSAAQLDRYNREHPSAPAPLPPTLSGFGS